MKQTRVTGAVARLYTYADQPPAVPVPLFEYLPEGTPTYGIDEPLTVPEGKVLVLGDNRENSSDGRVFGPISEDLIIGRAFMIMWPPGRIGAL